MFFILFSCVIIVLSGFAGLFIKNRPGLVAVLSSGGVIIGCICGLIPVISVLAGNSVEPLRLIWDIPFASFFIALDSLSAFFLLPIYIISALIAIYGGGYLSKYRGSTSAGTIGFFCNLTIAAMILVVVARNAMMFLIPWEIMALASFILATLDDERPPAYSSAWTYLTATHFATAFLLVMFILLGKNGHSLDFDKFVIAPGMAGTIFLLAAIGFGTKAAFMPFHIWMHALHNLEEETDTKTKTDVVPAHISISKGYPEVPGYLLALMSGLVIKTAIYGLLRTLTFLGQPVAWWGWLLIGFGAVSSILGALSALAQPMLKRLLAYCSIENMGIIAMGIGIGIVGLSANEQIVAVLGFAGALLHVVNHAVYKSLLFISAGAVQEKTKTQSIERLGGLLKKMPWTGTAFLVGSLSASGFPLFNGFVSEFLIYLAAFSGVKPHLAGNSVTSLGVITALALSGGLAAAVFAKVFGTVFLGEPRTEAAINVQEVDLVMRIPMLVLAAVCILLGLAAPIMLCLVAPTIAQITGFDLQTVQFSLGGVVDNFKLIVLIMGGFVVFTGILMLLKQRLLRGRVVEIQPTWDCGYLKPTPKMQYTASSFAWPLLNLFDTFIHEEHQETSSKIFPEKWSFRKSAFPEDFFEHKFYHPVFSKVDEVLTKLRCLQHGYMNIYILYILLTLVFLLIWQLG